MPQITDVDFSIPTVVVVDAEFEFECTFKDGSGTDDTQVYNKDTVTTNNFSDTEDFDILTVTQSTDTHTAIVTAKALSG